MTQSEMARTVPVTAPVVGEASRVRLAPGVMKRLEKARDVWTLQGPERVLVLDDTALAVVNAATVPECTVAAAIDALAVAFDTPRGDIAQDVLELLTEMRDRGFLIATV